MTAGMVNSLVRRGAEATLFNKETKLEMPSWGIALLAITFTIYFVTSGLIEYTFGRIIPTLVMVESPEENIDFEPLPTDETDATINKSLNPELEAVKPKPITASFRATIKLLSQKGGFRARFRGISIYIVNQFLISWAAQFLSILPFVPRWAAAILASVVCAQLSLAWTHIVISEPNPKTWLRRLPPMKTWKKVAIPTAILCLAEQIAILIPIYIAMACNMGKHLGTPNEVANMSSHEALMLTLRGLGLGALMIVLGFLLVIPADVALTRVQASLLSDAEETIVPFDRSFKGKFVPEIVGGSGVIGMLDAWKTFDWESRVRLVKTYIKTVLIEMAISILFVSIIVGELALVISKSKQVESNTGATVKIM